MILYDVLKIFWYIYYYVYLFKFVDVLWCGYCKFFVFEYEKVVKVFVDEGFEIKFGKVDVIE